MGGGFAWFLWVCVLPLCPFSHWHMILRQGLNALVGIDMSWAKRPEMMVALARAFISEVLAQLFNKVRRLCMPLELISASCYALEL